MGTTQYVKDQLKSMIVRDRNHPSVFLWSMGNEEWRIEGNVIGDRIIQDMQAYAKKLDPTRMMNCASSGGWGQGVSKHIEVMGFNYLGHGNTDDYHRDFPNTPSMGTEEGSTHATRGVYFDDTERQHLAAYDRSTSNGMFPSIEYCWNYYNSRPYLAGMFIWTGFDYRGEPTPFAWPSINSYFGMFDVCGFPKDNVWYLKSWWGNEPVLHLLPHWNLPTGKAGWKGKEGEPIKVVAYSNCDEVELFLNNKSQGRKTMLKDSHLEWEVPYKAGALKAFGYKNGKKVLTEIVETTGEPVALKITSHKPRVKADGKDVAIITVSVVDQKGREVPTAENLVEFDIAGPGKIIGVGNGDPTCLEPDKYIEGQVLQSPNTDPGVNQLTIPAPQWKRSLFSGKAQVIVQSRTDAGQIKLTARSKGLISSELLIDTE
jgi:beta-galactosidase